MFRDDVNSDFSPKTRHRGRWIAGGLGIVLIVVAGLIAGVFAVTPAVARGTSVLGIEIGGGDRARAATALRDGLAGRSAELASPVTVQIGTQTATVQPQDIGLAVDIDATVARAAHGWPKPWRMLLPGKTTVQPEVTVDAARLNTALQPVAAQAGAAMTMPAVTFDGVTPRPVYPKSGMGLDPQRSADAVGAAWLRSPVAEVPLVEIVPRSTAADVDRMITELAAPAVAGNVVVSTDKGTVTIDPAAIAASLVIDADPQGTLRPHIDEAALRAALSSQLAPLETAPRDATVTGQDGVARIVASSAGALVDTAKLATDLLPVLARPADRTLAAALISVSPSTTSEELTSLGIVEQVSTFTTQFSGGLTENRSKNIVQAAKEVDGAIVRPGETFSLNGHTGPRGYAEGYVDAPIIMDGKLVPGVGGGVSQFTTTIFNAAYYAGLQDVEHKPHSYWFSRYPAVIESTIFYPDLDLKFRNNTPYGVLIDTSYTEDSITVSMWSTRVYDSVTTEYSAKRNFTSPKTITLPAGRNCIATDGIQGFTQDAWRIFRKGGEEVQREKFTWRYDAEPRYLCGGDGASR